MDDHQSQYHQDPYKQVRTEEQQNFVSVSNTAIDWHMLIDTKEMKNYVGNCYEKFSDDLCLKLLFDHDYFWLK